ncbi:MAG: PAS domain S-box protein [Spartobacteria bacterium]|nr:PAS domain S-box protein [Spartobacteria bacterium]
MKPKDGAPEETIDQCRQHVRELELHESNMERVQAELARERDMARQYLDVLGVILVALDTHGDIILLNKFGREMLGYNEKKYPTQNWFDCFVPEDIRDEIKAIHERICRGEEPPLEYHENPIIAGNGKQRIIAWHNRMLTDEKGAIIGTLSSGADITENIQAQQELEKHRDHLEEMVNARTHELRTIVNAMAGREVRMAGLKKTIQTLRQQIIELGATPVADDPLIAPAPKNPEEP